jgi:broad specificity phosphatase PhoE
VSLPARAFWFLRHGETDWNAQGLSQGNIDIPLNPTGVAQAQAAARLLRGRGIAWIVSSPLSRAWDTAMMVAAEVGAPVSAQDDLREVSFGVHEGTAMEGSWFAAWVAGELTPENAESFAALRARAARAFTTALAHPAPVLVVAHGALFRALRAEMGLPPNVRTPNALPLFCEPGEPWTLTAAA